MGIHAINVINIYYENNMVSSVMPFSQAIQTVLRYLKFFARGKRQNTNCSFLKPLVIDSIWTTDSHRRQMSLSMMSRGLSVIKIELR